MAAYAANAKFYGKSYFLAKLMIFMKILILIKSIKSAFVKLDNESKRRMNLLAPEASRKLFGF